MMKNSFILKLKIIIKLKSVLSFCGAWITYTLRHDPQQANLKRNRLHSILFSMFTGIIGKSVLIHSTSSLMLFYTHLTYLLFYLQTHSLVESESLFQARRNI